MNIFPLDEDLDEAAKAHPTAYTKIILEASQMASTALHRHGCDEAFYAPTHENHPMTLWAGETSANWFYLRDYASALHDHFYGYDHDDIVSAESVPSDETHKSFRTLCAVDSSNVESALPDGPRTTIPRCMPDEYDCGDPVQSYRDYLLGEKVGQDWFEWSDDVPEWAFFETGVTLDEL